MSLEQKYGTVDRIERNGFGMINVDGSDKPAFFNNETLAHGKIAAGVRVHSRVVVSVESRPDVFVVRSLDLER